MTARRTRARPAWPALALALAAATCLPGGEPRAAAAKGTSMESTEKPATFAFTLTTRGGRPMPGGLMERDARLRVDFGAAVVTYEQHRSEADIAGEPIGTFRIPLAAERRQGLLAALQSAAFQGLGPTSGGDFSSSVLTYALERDGRRTEKVLTSGDRAQLQRIEALENELILLSMELFRHPLAAVRAEVRLVAEGDVERFELAVANIGTEPVVVPNPRRAGRAPGLTGGVRVAVAEPEVPGVTPLPPAFTTLAIEAPPQGKEEPADVTLGPGERVAARTVPWKRGGPKGAEYFAMSFLEGYAGPGEVSGAYRVRGAILSEPIDIPARSSP